jgi:hypothetical protein
MRTVEDLAGSAEAVHLAAGESVVLRPRPERTLAVSVHGGV